MSKALTEIQQAALFDIQEKIVETHELLIQEKEFQRRHEELMERRLDNAIRIGQNLLDFKTTLPHGKFMTFVQAEFEMNQATANDYMLLARNSGRVQNLEVPLRSAFELASPSMPPVVIQMVETRQIAPTVEAIREAKREILEQDVVAIPQAKAVLNRDNVPVATPHIISKNNEWYTPWEYLDAARRLMGSIDLDPASNEYANQAVMATKFYTQEDNGLSKPWPGKVWLNPPYGRDEAGSNQDVWSRRLIEQYNAGITEEAVLLVNAAVDTKWFHRLFQYSEREPHFFPLCLPDHRINFTTPNGSDSGSTHGSALIYLGPKIKEFYVIFSQFGLIFERMTYRW